MNGHLLDDLLVDVAHGLHRHLPGDDTVDDARLRNLHRHDVRLVDAVDLIHDHVRRHRPGVAPRLPIGHTGVRVDRPAALHPTELRATLGDHRRHLIDIPAAVGVRGLVGGDWLRDGVGLLALCRLVDRLADGAHLLLHDRFGDRLADGTHLLLHDRFGDRLADGAHLLLHGRLVDRLADRAHLLLHDGLGDRLHDGELLLTRRGLDDVAHLVVAAVFDDGFPHRLHDGGPLLTRLRLPHGALDGGAALGGLRFPHRLGNGVGLRVVDRLVGDADGLHLPLVVYRLEVEPVGLAGDRR